MEGGFILAAAANISGSVSQTSQFAFYTSWLFWLELLIQSKLCFQKLVDFSLWVGIDGWGERGLTKEYVLKFLVFFSLVCVGGGKRRGGGAKQK